MRRALIKVRTRPGSTPAARFTTSSDSVQSENWSSSHTANGSTAKPAEAARLPTTKRSLLQKQTTVGERRNFIVSLSVHPAPWGGGPQQRAAGHTDARP